MTDALQRNQNNGSKAQLAPAPQRERAARRFHRATGPRTPEGKRCSSLNALKDGLFARRLLNEAEKRYFQSQLCRLTAYWKPEGPSEEFCILELAQCSLDKERLYAALRAEIAREVNFVHDDRFERQLSEAERLTSGATLLHHLDNPVIVERAIRNLKDLRTLIQERGFEVEDDLQLLEDVYGPWQMAGVRLSFVGLYRYYAGMTLLGRDEGLKKDLLPAEECKSRFLGRLDEEIQYLESVKAKTVEYQAQRAEQGKEAAFVPDGNALDRLLRFDAHVDRKIDRTLEQLERLQRRRLGESLPPRLEVNLRRR